VTARLVGDLNCSCPEQNGQCHLRSKMTAFSPVM
jgi:hypothetical protein